MRTAILGSITSLALLTAAGLLGGCALVAGYDFSRYTEGESEVGSSGSSSAGGGGAASSSSSAGGAGGSGGAATTSSTGGGGATSSSSGAGGAGGAGGAPPTTILYEGQDPIIALAIDTTSVYFTTGKKAVDESRLFRIEKDGTMLLELANSQPYLEALALDPMLQFAYWSSNKGGKGTLRRVSTAGGAMPQLIFMPLERVGGIAFSTGNIYWTAHESGYVYWRTPGNGIYSVGGQSYPGPIVADNSNLYWVNSGNDGSADGTVVKADLVGKGFTALVNGQNSPDQIAISTNSVYWSNADGGVYSVPKNGIGSTSTYMSPQAPPAPCSSLAADEKDAYFARGSTVYHALAGVSNPATAYVTDLKAPLKIAIDTTALYVAGLGAGGKGTVIKVPR